MQSFEYRSVRYWTKEINGTLTGGRKIICLIRDIDDGTMAAASVETCRFAARRSPWGRLGSLLDVRKRLQRTRGGFHRCIHMQGPLCSIPLDHDLPKISIQSSLESPKHRRMRRRRPPDPRPIPEGAREPIYIHKK